MASSNFVFMTSCSKVSHGSAFYMLAIVAALLFSPRSIAQDFMCGNNELSRMGHVVEGHPERIAEMAQAKDELEAFTAHFQIAPARDGDQYVIPVVFHIIHNNGPENISDDQVRDGVLMMNQDFNQNNPDWADVQPEFLGIVANTGITFKLAQLDPDGNCTNGITRTQSTLTYQGDQDMKDLINWPRNRYLNIWVASSLGGAAGYSMYPSSVSGPWGDGTDGIAVLATYVGSIGTSSLSHSHTLSHEAGHWMNLKHCWGDSNDPGLASNCNIDDNVNDTPDTKGWTSCNLLGASCGSEKDNVENFMEYSYCSKMFTEGQKTRMVAALNSGTASRNNLWTSSNLALTGVNADPVICTVQFNSSTRTVCQGQSVQFTDMSYNGVTQWNWTFAGGSPATSTDADPFVTYDTPGLYDVSLTVGNGAQTQSAVQTQYVKVLPSTGMLLPFVEGFEALTSLPSDNWQVNDLNLDGTYAVSTDAAFSGSHSVRLHNTSSNGGRVDEFLSNTIDASLDPPLTMSFRYAFAKRLNSNNDALRIYLSMDCGESWSLRRTLLTDALVTAPNTSGSFVPNGPDQWALNDGITINAPFVVSNLRIKFKFDSGGGNDLWLDDININGASVGISEQVNANDGILSVWPNPAQDQLTIRANLDVSSPVTVDLVDLLGRSVRSIASENRPAGNNQWTVELGDIPAGMYLVRLQYSDAVRVVKLTKE